MLRTIIALLALHFTATLAVADSLPEGAVARIGTVAFHDPRMRSAAFSPDGKTLATSGAFVSTWDVATGKCYFRQLSKNFALIGFTPSGNTLRVVEDGIASEIDARTGKVIRSQQLERKPAKSDAGAIAPDGRFAAYPVTESISQQFDLETGKAVQSFNERIVGRLEYLFSPDGSFLAILNAGTEGEVALPVFDTATGKPAITIRDPGNAIWMAAVSPGRKRIATVAVIGRVKHTLALWDGTNGTLIRRFPIGATSLEFSPDGKRLAVADAEHLAVKIFDAADGKEIHSVRCTAGVALSGISGNASTLDVAKLLFSPDSSKLAVVTIENGVVLLDAVAGKPLAVSADYLGGVSRLRFTIEGKHLFIAANNLDIRDWRTGAVVRRLFDPREAAGQIYAVSPDVRRIAVADHNGSVRIVDVESGRTQLTKNGNDPVE